mgnify:CR=1 FL=1|jgi:hypothetical protein
MHQTGGAHRSNQQAHFAQIVSQPAMSRDADGHGTSMSVWIQGGQGHQRFVLAELEAGPQHPLELQHDGHGHEQRRALGDAAADDAIDG